MEIDKAGYLTGGGAAARVRVAVTADRGGLVAITLNIYQNRQALDVDGNAWWGWSSSAIRRLTPSRSG